MTNNFDVCGIDADFIPYRAAASAEPVHYHLFDEDNELVGEYHSKKEMESAKNDFEDFLMTSTEGWTHETVKQDLGLAHAKKACTTIVRKIKNKVKAKQYVFVLTGNDYFRRDLATVKKYKGNRDGIERPKYLKEIRQFMMEKYAAFCSEGIEADDIISVMMHTDYIKNGADSKLCSVIIDKDLNGTAGTHYDYMKDEMYFVSEENADKWMFTQALCGDTVDHIQGVPDISRELRKKYGLTNRKGVGIKTAEKIIDSCNDKFEMYNAVMECYVDFYGAGAIYKDHSGETHFKSAFEIADENFELIFMERIKGVRWSEYKKNYYVGSNEGEGSQ